MNRLRYLSIKAKLISIFSFTVFLSALLAFLTFYSLIKLNNGYSDLINGSVIRTIISSEIEADILDIRRLTWEISAYVGDGQKLSDIENQVNNNFDTMDNRFRDYNESLENDVVLEAADKKKSAADIEAAQSKADNQYRQIFTSILQAARNNDKNETEEILLSDNTKQTAEELTSAIMKISSEDALYSTEQQSNMDQFVQGIIIMVSIAYIVMVTMFLFVAAAVSKSIITPIRKLQESAKLVIAGDMSINMKTEQTDEVGQLSNIIGDLVDVFKNLLDNINSMADQLNQGDIDARVNENIFAGDYKQVAKSINTAIDGAISDLIEVMNIAKDYENGNFKTSIKKMPGKKAGIQTSFEHLQENLQNVSNDINALVKAALQGNLTARVDVEKYAGDWKDVILGINNLLAAVIEPVQEAAYVLDEVSKGNLGTTVKGDYQGDHALIKNSINATISNLDSYTKEISHVLGEVSKKNLNIDISRQYLGDFISIKDSINNIIDNFNFIMEEINASSIQVAAGAKQISQTSIYLAEGSVIQADSVDELYLSIDDISKQIQINAQNTSETRKLAMEVMGNVDIGNQDMKEMLVSMDEINDASESISKIVKVIDDLAFQTNLLALNAAVEAARAGQHGKGFAVVAEEVRTLALRSKSAAAETSMLIQTSIAKTNIGSHIAIKTAETLRLIITQISKITELISAAAIASDEQVHAIEQVNTGIKRISEVTQSNTASSEEAAAASEELSAQTDVFRNTVEQFKLRDQN